MRRRLITVLASTALIALLALAFLAPEGSTEVLGPGRDLRDWRISPTSSAGFTVVFKVVNTTGSSGFEAALAKGPYRLGIIVIYSRGSATMYLMRGDQNTWVSLGPVALGRDVNVSLQADLKAGRMNVSVDGDVWSYSFDIPGAPERFRLAAIPLAGNMTVEVRSLVLRIDGSAETLIAPEPGTATTTVPAVDNTTTITTTTTTTITMTTTTTTTTVTTTSTESAAWTSTTAGARVSALTRLMVTLVAVLVAAAAYWAMRRG